MKIWLYLDEDAMSHLLTQELRLRGVDVLTALEAGMIEKPDESHLEFASKEGRVLYSFNVGDFCRLHGEFLAAGKEHAGIILAQQQKYSIGEQLRRLVRFVTLVKSEDMKNRLAFLSAWG